MGQIILSLIGLIFAVLAVRAKNPIFNILGILGVALIISIKLIGQGSELLGAIMTFAYMGLSISFFLIISSLSPIDEHRFILPISNMKSVGGIILAVTLLGGILLSFEDSSDQLNRFAENIISLQATLNNIFVDNSLVFILLSTFALIVIFLIISLLGPKELSND